MGIVCCNDHSPSIQVEKKKSNADQGNVLDSDSNVDIVEKLKMSNISTKLGNIPKFIETYPYKSDDNQLLKNHSLSYSNSKLNFWMELSPKDNS